MKKVHGFFVVLVIILGIFFVGIGINNKISRVIPPPASTEKARVEGVEASSKQVKYVVDGDTLKLTTGGEARLIGVNAPENGQPGYDSAKQALSDMVSGKTLDTVADVDKIDRYGRALEYIYVGNTFVNLELVKRGLAVAETMPPNVSHTADFASAQSCARKNCLGMWEGLCNQGASSCIQISSINPGTPGKYNPDTQQVGIINTCSEEKNLNGYKIINNGFENSYTFKDTVIKSKQSIELHSGCGKDTSANLYWACPEMSNSIWGNSGHAYLFDNTGKLVSDITY